MALQFIEVEEAILLSLFDGWRVSFWRLVGGEERVLHTFCCYDFFSLCTILTRPWSAVCCSTYGHFTAAPWRSFQMKLIWSRQGSKMNKKWTSFVSLSLSRLCLSFLVVCWFIMKSNNWILVSLDQVSGLGEVFQLLSSWKLFFSCNLISWQYYRTRKKEIKSRSLEVRY